MVQAGSLTQPGGRRVRSLGSQRNGDLASDAIAAPAWSDPLRSGVHVGFCAGGWVWLRPGLQDDVLANLAADVRAGVADADAEGAVGDVDDPLEVGPAGRSDGPGRGDRVGDLGARRTVRQGTVRHGTGRRAGRLRV